LLANFKFNIIVIISYIVPGIEEIKQKSCHLVLSFTAISVILLCCIIRIENSFALMLF